MATIIKIGHASISEDGTANGTAGDSTGKEVYVIENYDVAVRLKPTVVLRPKSVKLAELSALACEAGCENNAIGYSQNGRNTLYKEAKVVDFDLAKITNNCNADCSSFMTVCAIAGGATFSYGYAGGSNAPTTSNMRAWFTRRYENYEALTSDTYLTKVDYLRRGDILVKEGTHTVMVLENGSEADITDDLDLDISTLKIVTKLTDIKPNSAHVKVSITKMHNGVKTTITEDELENYTWNYSYRSLIDTKTDPSTSKLEVKSTIKEFDITGLKTNHPYAIKILATESDKKTSISSSEVIFVTPHSYPEAIKNLEVTFNSSDKAFNISFDPPDSWGLSSLTRCYRVSFIKNGKIINYNDDLITVGDSKNKSIDISKESFTCGDTLQLGVQTGLKDGTSFTCDQTMFRSSQPFYLNNDLNIINKIYIKIQNIFKLAIAHIKKGI